MQTTSTQPTSNRNHEAARSDLQHPQGREWGLQQKVRIHDVKLALHSINADIVFLQEVQDKNERMVNRQNYPQGTQLDFLCTGNYLHRAYGMNAVYPHGHHGNAIVSRHAIGRHLNHDISDHALERRGLLHAVSQFKTSKGALDVHLINTHFGLIKRSRVRQAEFLIEFVKSEIQRRAPLIIAGDFNDWQRGVDEVLHVSWTCSRLLLNSTAGSQSRGCAIGWSRGASCRARTSHAPIPA